MYYVRCLAYQIAKYYDMMGLSLVETLISKIWELELL